MQKRSGDMFDYIHEANIVLVTTNATITKKGTLVMGAGAAGQAEATFPALPKVFGDAVLRNGNKYGVILHPSYPSAERDPSRIAREHKMGIFQVKYNWWQKASLELIENSAGQLMYIAGNNPDLLFYLNYPGIGYGQLSDKAVWDTIKVLPDNVHVWRFDEWPEYLKRSENVQQKP